MHRLDPTSLHAIGMITLIAGWDFLPVVEALCRPFTEFVPLLFTGAWR